MKVSSMSAILISLALTGCAAYGGATLLPIPLELSATHGTTVRSAVAIKTSTGVRFHGAVCRRSIAQAATRLRVERIENSGYITASAVHSLPIRNPRLSGCSFFDVATDWELKPTEHVRICALRGGNACPSSKME